MRFFKCLVAVMASAMLLSGCATVRAGFVDVHQWWHPDCLMTVKPMVAARIATSVTNLLAEHYPDRTVFHFPDCRGPIAHSLDDSLRMHGYGVDDNRGNAPELVTSHDVPLGIWTDTLGYGDVIRVTVHVAQFTVSRVFTSVTGRKAGPWTITAYVANAN